MVLNIGIPAKPKTYTTFNQCEIEKKLYLVTGSQGSPFGARHNGFYPAMLRSGEITNDIISPLTSGIHTTAYNLKTVSYIEIVIINHL